MEEVIQSDIAIVQQVRQNAYAPYSLFKVGALVRFRNSDNYYTGVNVENASYGASICAERSALCKGVTGGEHTPIRYVIVATHADEPAVPCAVCLQCLAEFSDENTFVHLIGTPGTLVSYRFSDLLPHPFTHFVGKDSK